MFTELKVVMAYTDYPAAWMSRDVLVNDVDLTVTDVDGKKVAYPNECGMGGRVSRRRNSADRENNVEVVKLPTDKLFMLCRNTLEVIVHVRRHALSTKFQPVALVITGDFDFDKVKVEDDTAQDYEDVPGKEPFDFLGFLKTILPGLLGVLFVVFL